MPIKKTENLSFPEKDRPIQCCHKCFLFAPAIPCYGRHNRHVGCGGFVFERKHLTQSRFAQLTEAERNIIQEQCITGTRYAQFQRLGIPIPPNCPKCNSNFVFRLTFRDHMRLIFDKGLSARDFDKTYECHRCGHKW